MKTGDSLLNQFKAARRVSVPLVAVTTPDPAATIEHLCDVAGDKPALLVWDVLLGLSSRNEAGHAARAALVADFDPTAGNPAELMKLAAKLPEDAVLFVHLAHRWLGDPSVVQGVWNLRDRFKADGRMLVMLAPSIDLPPELAGDVVVFDEPLPDGEQLAAIVTGQHEAAQLNVAAETLAKAVEAVQGLPAFQAEQVCAMSLGKNGLDIPNLWERKRRQIELTPGLKVHRDPVTFADVGGVELVKDFLRRILGGQARPNAVVFVDEIEKFLAGATGGSDTSGISQDQLGTLLSYMQDQAAAGCIFVGPPGSAKSMVAKATGNEAGIPTIQLDLGGMKGSLVGQSEQNLRAALKVITSVSNGRSLWIATCNAIGDLPPELRRRFTLGTFFFDLPDAGERATIWRLWSRKYGLTPEGADRVQVPNDDGWTGAEIKQCCDIAWRLGCDVADAARFVVPVSRSAADQLERLRKAAEGRFLSASRPGVYTREPAPQSNNGKTATPRTRRMATVED